jgi:hypothetical protein
VGVASVNYLVNTITTKTNLANSVNSLMSVSRTITANANNIRIYSISGTPYYAEITSETGSLLLTTDGSDILIM